MIFLTLSACSSDNRFPPEITQFIAYEHNPVFAGTGKDTWDKMIRERGYILFENGLYRLWYTGYNDSLSDKKLLGYAESNDGIHWQRYKYNPLVKDDWVEDMCVVKYRQRYYMFAEGDGDIAHLLISNDGIKWQEKGSLKIFQTNGEPISAGPFGTPTVFIENGKFYLFYERNDLGIWLATSNDFINWQNVQDEAVIKMGPQNYDRYAVAADQVIKYKDHYYLYYHATAFKSWKDWSTNVAVSDDLIHWKKFPRNPIIGDNKSSGILLINGKDIRLYTMHPDVNLYFNQE